MKNTVAFQTHQTGNMVVVLIDLLLVDSKSLIVMGDEDITDLKESSTTAMDLTVGEVTKACRGARQGTVALPGCAVDTKKGRVVGMNTTRRGEGVVSDGGMTTSAADAVASIEVIGVVLLSHHGAMSATEREAAPLKQYRGSESSKG